MAEYNTFLDINEVKGAKTVLPSTAHAKISMRLVPNQTSAKITELFEKHFRAICPP